MRQHSHHARTATHWLTCLGFALLASLARADDYRISYEVAIAPGTELARVELRLEGAQLPSKLVLHTDPDRHSDFNASRELVREGDTVSWRPAGTDDVLRYSFAVNARKDSSSYDSMITDDWAILRSDKLVPPIAVTAARGLRSSARLRFQLPAGWSSAAPYAEVPDSEHHYRLTDPGRRFIRPKGWLILGHIASRQDRAGSTSVRVAAPSGQRARLQDTLAFIRWTLPHIQAVVPDFPPRLLVVTADDPMWRGGLSGPNSLFMHLDRPLISGNRTSSLVHELMHVGSGIDGTERSDWVVEGIAEYYAVAVLYRSGAIRERRFQDTLAELAAWGEESKELFTGDSAGATTARAVTLLHSLDSELRQLSEGRASLDDVVTRLSQGGGDITVLALVETAEAVAGTRLASLAKVRARLDRTRN